MLPVNSTLLPTVSRFFDDNWTNLFDWSNPRGRFSDSNLTMPSVNIRETADAFLVEMAAPGMKKSDFNIEIDNNVLNIKSEVKDEQVNEGESYTRKEFNYNSFQRSFHLNKDVVDDAKINAKYSDGILYINIPKKDEVKEKPARMIKIS